MGVLGWTEPEALRADALAIVLAYEGWKEQRYGLERMIYGAQGVKLPPLPPRNMKPGSRASWDDTWRNFAKEHNARWRAGERAKRRASARPPREGKLPAS